MSTTTSSRTSTVSTLWCTCSLWHVAVQARATIAHERSIRATSTAVSAECRHSTSLPPRPTRSMLLVSAGIRHLSDEKTLNSMDATKLMDRFVNEEIQF